MSKIGHKLGPKGGREGKPRESTRILDEASRLRRQRKALEALEQDNFHDDPHADLGNFDNNFLIIKYI